MTGKNATWENDKDLKGFGLAGPRAYVVTAAAVALALMVRLMTDSFWKERLPFASFFLAVVFLAQFVDWKPTLLSILSGFFLGAWFFLGPRHSLIIHDPFNQVTAFLYLVVCFFVLYVSSRMRGALRRERAARVALTQLAAIIDSSDDAIVGKTLDGEIVSWNAAAQKLYGYTEAEAVGKKIDLLGRESAPCLRVQRGEHVSHFETTRKKKDGSTVEVSLCISPVRDKGGKVIGVSTIARDISERKKAEREKEQLLGELQKALREVKTLSGLFPICSYCKKIRDDKGYWNQIEIYIRDHSSANFTHSICPECARENYADYYKPAGPGTVAKG